MPLFGPPNIEKMKAKGDVKGLVKALHFWDSNVQEKAAEALGQLGDARAVEPLVSTLRSGPLFSSVRLAVSIALAQLGNENGVDSLIAILSFGESEYFRGDAAKALGQLGGERAAEPLAKALVSEKNTDVRRTVAEALAEIDAHLNDSHRATIAVYLAISKGGWEKIRKLGDTAIDPLINILKNPDLFKSYIGTEDARAYKSAALTLAQIGGTRAIDFLKSALEDKHWLVRDAATEALAKSGNDVHAVESFVAQLDDMEKRTNAAEWLGRIGKATAVMPLIARLQQDRYAVAQPEEHMSNNELSRHYATIRGVEATIHALGTIGDERAVVPLIQLLQDKAIPEGIRRRAAAALGQIGNERAIVPLIQVLQDRSISDDVRVHAAEALGQMGDLRAVDALIEMFQNPLPGLRQTKTLRGFERMLKHRDKIARVTAESLKAILKTENATVFYRDIENDEISYTFDFSAICQLARQELIRRGDEV